MPGWAAMVFFLPVLPPMERMSVVITMYSRKTTHPIVQTTHSKGYLVKAMFTREIRPIIPTMVSG